MSVTQRVKEAREQEIGRKVLLIIEELGKGQDWLFGRTYKKGRIKIKFNMGWEDNHKKILWDNQLVFHEHAEEVFAGLMENRIRVYRPDIAGWSDALDEAYELALRTQENRKSMIAEKNFGVRQMGEAKEK